MVAADQLTRDRLLAATGIDQFLDVIDVAPEALCEMRPVVLQSMETGDMGRHVMECHQLLAELGGPDAKAFARIAEQLARELE